MLEETLKAVGSLAAAVVLPLVVLCGVSQLARRLTRARDNKLVDELIAAKGAKQIAGMETIDWQKLDRAGERRWQEALRGQRRARKPTEPADVVVFRERAR